MPTNPDALVTTDWLAAHIDDDTVVVADVDEDLTAYGKGHVPGAIGFDWTEDFRHPLKRTFLDKDGFARLLSERGIGEDDHVVLYGGNNNWFAAYAYWYFRVFGHDKVSLMNGGRVKWEAEDRPETQDVPERRTTSYVAKDADESIRARRDQILSDYVGAEGDKRLIDVRSPEEFRGDKIAPDHLPNEGAQVPGHIPGAANVPWARAVDPATGEFLAPGQLQELYAEAGITAAADTVAYCRIGERAAHTWFALHEILGYDRVRNYDGSWTEYGSLIDVPVER